MLTLKSSEGTDPSASVTQELERTERVVGDRHRAAKLNTTVPRAKVAHSQVRRPSKPICLHFVHSQQRTKDELPESIGEEGREDGRRRSSGPQSFHTTAHSKGTASHSVRQWLHRIPAGLKVQFPSDDAIPKRGQNMFAILKDTGVSILYSRRLSSNIYKCQGTWGKVSLHEESTSLPLQ